MRKSLRLVITAATGAAVFATGAAITVASPANAGVSTVRALDAAAVAGIDFDSNKFIPPSGSDKITFKVHLTNAYAAADKPAKVTVRYLKVDEAESAAHTADVTQLGTVASVPTDNKADVAGSIPVSSSDKPGDWKYQVGITQGGATGDPTYGSWTPLAVAKATRITGANVDPDPVYVKSGKDTDVYVSFKLERGGAANEEKITDVRLESEDTDDYYPLTLAGLESDDSYHDSTSFDYSTSAGDWQLKVTVERGSKKYSFVKGFEVKKSGSTKAKSKITLLASPTKVKKGKTTKLSGKVYRGSKAWSKKIVKLYFKKKGTTKWKFVGYIGASSTGKYTKVVKPKYDGYWRTQATGTSGTYGSLSNIKFVDVK
ncbi:hypothetical protein N5079_02400 [Planotetraspora sp. A-T 1434]|uniref:hypothetical protein n=1 Tax=Planotetraspora sp. A-T 1434 TaxID=2979219 RepID=UPI0021C13747|nr:hypothetical protein [Planotetraspora sp. A-T 1434]MCT9929065.1 hypothetical protein [Planotetraspora sp. A-T 1434]